MQIYIKIMTLTQTDKNNQEKKSHTFFQNNDDQKTSLDDTQTGLLTLLAFK